MRSHVLTLTENDWASKKQRSTFIIESTNSGAIARIKKEMNSFYKQNLGGLSKSIICDEGSEQEDGVKLRDLFLSDKTVLSNVYGIKIEINDVEGLLPESGVQERLFDFCSDIVLETKWKLLRCIAENSYSLVQINTIGENQTKYYYKE